MTAPLPAATGLPVADRALRAAAVVEPLSLVVLLVNLATVHVEAVASVAGPTHGTAYLVGIGATWAGGASSRARLLAWVPAVGALLALRSSRPEGR